jgi:hypothetical protein
MLAFARTRPREIRTAPSRHRAKVQRRQMITPAPVSRTAPSSRQTAPGFLKGGEGSRRSRFPQREDRNMAKPNTTSAETGTRRYVLEVTFTVDFTADEHAQTPQAIRNETRSWLESLGATVQAVNVRRAG